MKKKTNKKIKLLLIKIDKYNLSIKKEKEKILIAQQKIKEIRKKCKHQFISEGIYSGICLKCKICGEIAGA